MKSIIAGLVFLFLGGLVGVQAIISIVEERGRSVQRSGGALAFQGDPGQSRMKGEFSPTPTPTPVPSPTPIPDPYLGEPGVAVASVRVPILMYHYVGENPNPEDTARDRLSVTPDQFKAQMNYLSTEGYTTISFDTLDDMIKGDQTGPAKPIVLTFDDGYIDFYYNAYPLLVEFGMTATVFVPTGLVGKDAYLTWAMIEEVSRISSVSFMSHGVSHIALTALSPERVRQELVESRDALAEHTGKSATWLAWPYGSVSGTTVRIAKDVGYVGAMGTISGVIQNASYRFNLYRQRITGEMTVEDFAARL